MQGRIKRRALPAVGALAAVVLATAASAYFTGAGTGTGEAKVGGTAPTVKIEGKTEGELYPGGTATVKVKLTEGSHAGYVGSVSLASITPDESHSACVTTVGVAPANAFTMQPIKVEETLAADAAKEVTGTLAMNETGVDQDSCKGATLTLHFTSN